MIPKRYKKKRRNINMDFSSLNPHTSNALNIAARKNDVETVERLLKKLNPSCVDNRGWTCLHEAAAHDSYECLMLILSHPDCRPLGETHEGHTTLYLAVRHLSSIKTIRSILDSVDEIANYGSTEGVTPLHVASAMGNLEAVQLLLDYGAMVNVQDFDGDTPLHDAALESQHEAVRLLLHAGGDTDIKNEANYTAFHLACCKGSIQTVEYMFPFISDINSLTYNGETPLMLAVQSCNDKIIDFLLQHGADPHYKNIFDELALNIALQMGCDSMFKTLLNVTEIEKINRDLVLYACKPHNFKFEIIEDVLNHGFGPEFFDFIEPFHVTLEQIGDLQPQYLTNAPLNSYLNICEYIYKQNEEKFKEFFHLFLLRGVDVNALDVNECPPIVYIHYTAHNECFIAVLKILLEYNCDIDYCSSSICVNRDQCIPDAFLASLTSDPTTMPYMIPYSLRCEPERLLEFAYANGVLSRISPHVQHLLLSMIDSDYTSKGITAETLTYHVLSLQHLCRLKVRSVLKNKRNQVQNTKQFLDILRNLSLPASLKNYIQYFSLYCRDSL